MFHREEFLVAGHEELGVAGFRQGEQITVLRVRRDGAGWRVRTKKGEIPKARGEQLGRAGAKSRPEKRPTGDIAEFRYERVTSDERERLALPSVEKLGWCAKWRQQRGEQDVGVEDQAYQGRLARSL